MRSPFFSIPRTVHQNVRDASELLFRMILLWPKRLHFFALIYTLWANGRYNTKRAEETNLPIHTYD